MVEITEDRVKIQGDKVSILADYMAFISALFERFCVEEEMPEDVFKELFTMAVEVAVDDAAEHVGENEDEEVEVEHSDYLS